MSKKRKKPDSWYHQSAAIPYIEGPDGEVRIVLITSRKQKNWIVPKGIVDSGLTPAESAAKECEEEAGIKGIIDPTPVGQYKSKKWGGTCRVDVYLLAVMEIANDWPEASWRCRVFVSPAKAVALVRNPELRKILAHFPKLLPGIHPASESSESCDSNQENPKPCTT